MFFHGPDERASLTADVFVPQCLPVDRLHLSDHAEYRSWTKLVKLSEKVPDVGLEFQVQVNLHHARHI